MESGVVRDGEDLVPFVFQFLVLLAYDNSQLVSIPQVSGCLRASSVYMNMYTNIDKPRLQTSNMYMYMYM